MMLTADVPNNTNADGTHCLKQQQKRSPAQIPKKEDEQAVIQGVSQARREAPVLRETGSFRSDVWAQLQTA
jgi:hypothetical protein